MRYGTSHLSNVLKSVRPAQPDEPRDPDWHPYDSGEEENPREAYLRDLGPLLVYLAETLKEEAQRTGEALAKGRLMGLYEAVRLLVAQAQVFGLDLNDLGLCPGFDPDEALLSRNGPGHFAG